MTNASILGNSIIAEEVRLVNAKYCLKLIVTDFACVMILLNFNELDFMTVAKDIVSSSISNSGLINFRITMQRLLELLDLEEEDDYGILRPTEYAFRTAVKLVVEAYYAIGENFPKASTATDDRGSITLDWTSLDPERTVRLFCPCSPERPVDIYHHASDEYGVDDVVSVPTLVRWLQWFNGQ